MSLITKIVEYLKQLFPIGAPTARLLFVGHDFKFLKHVINYFKQKDDFVVQLHSYQGHALQNIEELMRELPKFDIIFCEWGLDNIKWMSKHKLKRQKLIVRIHRQEFQTKFLSETSWENVDAIIFINTHPMHVFVSLFPEQVNKCHLIYNLIDCKRLDVVKDENAQYSLGMLGILPKRKAPHIALQILSEMRKYDARYKLVIKSKMPEELDWLWRRPEERSYYDDFFKSIDNLNLADAVVFEPHGDDVPEWFRKIGFVLSTSDYEGSHQSIAEGMASGAVPIIRNWLGSEELYPVKYNFRTVSEAVELIRLMTDDKNYNLESDKVRQYAAQLFDLQVINSEYDKLLSSFRSHG